MPFSQLPCPAIDLILQRPPMLVVDQLIERDRQQNTAKVVATLPEAAMFIEDGRVLPELLIELLAQAMAAVNGYDARLDGVTTREGFLVGVDDFVCNLLPQPGETVVMNIKKKFEFGPVTIMAGEIIGSQEQVFAQADIKAWEAGK